MKCPILIPDTVVVSSGGAIQSWYFTSSKTGVVLRKNYNKRNAGEIFNAFFQVSPLSAQIEKGTGVEGDHNDHRLSIRNIMKMIANLKPNQEALDLDKEGGFPPMAFVWMSDGQKKGYGPHEFYHVLTEQLAEVSMMQPYVFSRGNPWDPTWPVEEIHKTLLCKYEAHQDLKAPTYVV